MPAADGGYAPRFLSIFRILSFSRFDLDAPPPWANCPMNLNRLGQDKNIMSDETAQQIFSVFYSPRNSHASFTTIYVEILMSGCIISYIPECLQADNLKLYKPLPKLINE